METQKKDDLEDVRRMARENRKSIERMNEEIKRLKRRLEGSDKDRPEDSASGHKSSTS
jgi:hypothetical protein